MALLDAIYSMVPGSGVHRDNLSEYFCRIVGHATSYQSNPQQVHSLAPGRWRATVQPSALLPVGRADHRLTPGHTNGRGVANGRGGADLAMLATGPAGTVLGTWCALARHQITSGSANGRSVALGRERSTVQPSELAIVEIFTVAENAAPPGEVPQGKAPLRSFPAKCITSQQRPNRGRAGLASG